MNVGSKSVTAQRQRIKDKRRQRADKNKKHRELRAKPFITLDINFEPLLKAIKQANEIIKNTFEQIKQNLSKIFPVPAMLKFYLDLQKADNTRPNKHLIGWGRLQNGS